MCQRPFEIEHIKKSDTALYPVLKIHRETTGPISQALKADSRIEIEREVISINISVGALEVSIQTHILNQRKQCEYKEICYTLGKGRPLAKFSLR